MSTAAGSVTALLSRHINCNELISPPVTSRVWAALRSVKVHSFMKNEDTSRRASGVSSRIAADSTFWAIISTTSVMLISSQKTVDLHEAHASDCRRLSIERLVGILIVLDGRIVRFPKVKRKLEMPNVDLGTNEAYLSYRIITNIVTPYSNSTNDQTS